MEGKLHSSSVTSLINVALNPNATLTDVYMIGLVSRKLRLPRKVDIYEYNFYEWLPDFCIQCGYVCNMPLLQGRITETCASCYTRERHKDKLYCKENLSQLLLALTTITGYQEREIRYLILKQVQKRKSINHE